MPKAPGGFMVSRTRPALRRKQSLLNSFSSIHSFSHIPILLFALLSSNINSGLCTKLSLQPPNITCYQCHVNDMGTCNTGQCVGIACFKVEAKNNFKISVQKGCLAYAHKQHCLKTSLLGVEAIKCICHSAWCNGDTRLSELGLEEREILHGHSDPNAVAPGNGASNGNNNIRSQLYRSLSERSTPIVSRWSVNFTIMVVFVCLFVGGAIIIFAMNTVCIHSC